MRLFAIMLVFVVLTFVVFVFVVFVFVAFVYVFVAFVFVFVAFFCICCVCICICCVCICCVCICCVCICGICIFVFAFVFILWALQCILHGAAWCRIPPVGRLSACSLSALGLCVFCMYVSFVMIWQFYAILHLSPAIEGTLLVAYLHLVWPFRLTPVLPEMYNKIISLGPRCLKWICLLVKGKNSIFWWANGWGFFNPQYTIYTSTCSAVAVMRQLNVCIRR